MKREKLVEKVTHQSHVSVQKLDPSAGGKDSEIKFILCDVCLLGINTASGKGLPLMTQLQITLVRCHKKYVCFSRLFPSTESRLKICQQGKVFFTFFSFC